MKHTACCGHQEKNAIARDKGYDEIYIVDPRYYEGNVLDYIKDNKYTDVLIINSVMNANTEIRLSEMKTII